ncbi:MAG TPA: hypothetical protein VFL91_02480 [Thermomicrobiales bacterium]|nr:hypothetical protein [Thermomicrobiales bacterium]
MMVALAIGLWILVFAPLTLLPLLLGGDERDLDAAGVMTRRPAGPETVVVLPARAGRDDRAARDEDLRVAAAWLATHDHAA